MWALLLHPERALATSSFPQEPLLVAAAPHQHSGCWVPPWHSPPGLPSVLFFTRFQLFWQVFCKAHSGGFALHPGCFDQSCLQSSFQPLVNVRYYLPESLLLNLDKSRGKRKSPIKGKALKPPAGAATADEEGLDTMSGPLTARAAPSPLDYCLMCKGFHPNVRPECRNTRAGAVPLVSQLGRVCASL